ncbi:hypothetical protein CEXT_668951 [Caerostris extrusa]|uniref:Uncharacterized protein n=1 Tax=Caerostris extrusa TaxID=172846 RepID=A0AAV4NM86_CAEEX|nr:hypothetical protein CEXT_668951 [Caerostris extrusa]
MKVHSYLKRRVKDEREREKKVERRKKKIKPFPGWKKKRNSLIKKKGRVVCSLKNILLSQKVNFYSVGNPFFEKGEMLRQRKCAYRRSKNLDNDKNRETTTSTSSFLARMKYNERGRQFPDASILLST